MKRKILLVLLILILFPVVCFAGSVKLAWQKSISSDVVKYRIYTSLISGLYASGYDENARTIIDSSSDSWTTATIEGLSDGLRYYFVVTAVDNTGLESGFSNEVAITIGTSNPNPVTTGFVTPAPPVKLAMVDMILI